MHERLGLKHTELPHQESCLARLCFDISNFGSKSYRLEEKLQTPSHLLPAFPLFPTH